MSKPTISTYMTRDPWTIGPDERIATAYEVMSTHTVRHLPVMERGAVVGIVSQRDLFFMEGLRRIDPETGKVEAAMSPEPYAVPPETPVDEVARRMAESWVRRGAGGAGGQASRHLHHHGRAARADGHDRRRGRALIAGGRRHAGCSRKVA